MLHAIVVHNQHHQIDRLPSDLEPEASSGHHKKCRSAPSLRSAAARHTAPILRSDDESALEHRRYYRHTFGVPENIFWNTGIRCRLNLVENIRGRLYPIR